MRIVALVPGEIGDQILFFPTLEDLQQSYPNATIDVVVAPRVKEAYRVCKSVQNVILFDFQGRNSLADFGNLLGVLRDREYTLALTLGQRWAGRLLLWLAGIPTRVGFTQGAGETFLTRLATLNPNQYTAATYHDLLKGLGIDKPCPELSISVPAKDLDWADGERKRLGIQGGGYVMIHDRSEQADPGTSYPIASWLGVLKDFQQRQPDLPIVVLQEPENEAFVRSLVQANSQLKVTAPADMGKQAAMIAGANLMLCTEGAPMQLAVAVKTYTLALFAATDPARSLPADKRFAGVKSLTGKVEDISPQTVLEKVWGG